MTRRGHRPATVASHSASEEELKSELSHTSLRRVSGGRDTVRRFVRARYDVVPTFRRRYRMFAHDSNAHACIPVDYPRVRNRLDRVRNDLQRDPFELPDPAERPRSG